MPRTTNSKVGPVKVASISLPPSIYFALDGLAKGRGCASKSAYITKLVKADMRRQSRPAKRNDDD